jgi:hypothetical protein
VIERSYKTIREWFLLRANQIQQHSREGLMALVVR